MSISNMRFRHAMPIIQVLADANIKNGDKFAVIGDPESPESTLVVFEGGRVQGYKRTVSWLASLVSASASNPDINAVIAKITSVVEYLESQENLRQLCINTEGSSSQFRRAAINLDRLGTVYNSASREEDAMACWSLERRMSTICTRQLGLRLGPLPSTPARSLLSANPLPLTPSEGTGSIEVGLAEAMEENGVGGAGEV